MNLDHVAVTTTREKMEETITWYCENVGAKVLYFDETWGLVSVPNNGKIAFVVKDQHPPHIAFSICEDTYNSFLEKGKRFKKHRDDSESFYSVDPSGNFVEFLKWPKKT